MKKLIVFFSLFCLILGLCACANDSATDPTRDAAPLTDPSTTAPVTNPSSPVTNPSAPTTGPSTPATTPSTPATTPSAPATNPSAPETSPTSPTQTECAHQYTAVVTPPTATQDGYTTYTCSLCGDSYIDDLVPATCSVGLAYIISSDSQSYIVAGIGTCTDTEIYIPAVHDGLPVTGIGESAFRGLESISAVIIPDSVTSIGDSAFRACTGLKQVNIPDGVTTISSYSFLSCASLTSISIPDGVTSIGEYAFHRCTGLTSVNIPKSVTSIGLGAFSVCTNLHAVYLQDIAAWCRINFEDYTCSPLCNAAALYVNGQKVVNLTIPDTVTTLNNYAFMHCTSLVSVTIPDQVTSIGQNVFKGCVNLTEISVNAANSNYCSVDGVLFSKDMTQLMQYPAAKTDAVYAIPDGVCSISDSAFWFSENLTNVTIPNSVTSIEKCAFYSCTNLTSITFAGTMDQWNAVALGDFWNDKIPQMNVVCTDGTIPLT